MIAATMMTTITTIPITDCLSGGVTLGGTKTAAREVDKALKEIMEKIGI